jgi:uncharacterized protein
VKPIQLGTPNITIDPMKLIEGRMLVVGNSGSGKSYLMRVLCEGVVGQIPTIILDREGEFSTLRENHDVALIGDGGEADTSVATAAKLARSLVELGISAVVNLYDLSKQDKRKFVRLFLESLLNLPRSLWRPMLVIVDEAHEFCPESGREAESREAVIRLMDQGRKRGIGGILATQRFAKLSKDAAGEANNVCVGRIVQDVDLRRASDTLGFSGKSEWATLRGLDPGQWFAFGPAFSHAGIEKFTGLRAKTTHPKPGERHKLQPPKPSRAILKVAPQLQELKQAVIAEQDELTRLRAEVKELRAARGKPAPAPGKSVAEHAREVAQASITGFIQGTEAEAVHARALVAKFVKGLETELFKLVPPPKSVRGHNARTIARDPSADPEENERWHRAAQELRRREAQHAAQPPHPARRRTPAAPTDPTIGKGGLYRMMVALAQHEGGLTRQQLAVLASMSSKGGGFGNYLSKMRSNGWLEEERDLLTLTDDGYAALGDYPPLPTGAELARWWINKAGASKGRILQTIIDAGPHGMDRDALARAAGYEPTGGGFANYLGWLRTMTLINGSKVLVADPLFFNH